MQKRLFISLIVYIFSFHAEGQTSIEGLIKAETNFASYCVSNDTRAAFLKFLDNAGVVFENGRPLNGIDAWTKKEKRPGVLNWYPLYAEIAASGDFGFTTGPWTFQAGTISDSVIATGHYTTVWHRKNDGEWKFLVDIGTNGNPLPSGKSLFKTERSKADFKAGNKNSLLHAEKKFIKMTAKSVQRAYNYYMSSWYCLLKRNNIEPEASRAANKKAIISVPENIGYTILGSAISSSGDLGFVYGSTVINNKTDNYLRIWRKEKDGWKIAAEVLRY